MNSFFVALCSVVFSTHSFFPKKNVVHFTKKFPYTRWYISALWSLLWLQPNNLFNLDGRHWQKRHKINAFGCYSKRFLSMDNGIIHQIAVHFFLLLTFGFVVCKIIFRNSFSFSLALFLLFVPFLAIEWCECELFMKYKLLSTSVCRSVTRMGDGMQTEKKHK